MSVIIDLNNKEVLRIQNGIFALLHETVAELIEEKKINSSGINEFLKKTDQSVYGPGGVSADLSDHLKTKQEMLLLACLVKEAIELKYENFNYFIGCIDHLNEFHNKLLEYANELPDSAAPQ